MEKILVVSHGHPELSAGGAEHCAYSLFTELKKNPSIKASFLAWTGKPAYERGGTPFSAFQGREDETILFTHDFDHFLFSQKSDIFDEFADYLRHLAPDVIHLHHYTKIGLEFIALARRLLPSVRIVLTLHEYLAICHNYGQMVKSDGRTLCYASSPQDCTGCYPDIPPTEFLLRNKFIQSHFEMVDLFISPSEFLRKRYVDWGLPADKILALDNATRSFRPLPPRPLGPSEGRAQFAFFGQINPYKGLLELLKAFELMSQSADAGRLNLRLVVHGANLEYNKNEYVEAVTKALIRNAGRVHFAGPYRFEDLPRLMSAADWVVVPSVWWENSPLVIEEALAHKRPVLCSNIGGMAEKVTPGRDGYHFQAGNPFDMAGTMLQLASNPEVWDRLYRSMRKPMSVAEWTERHLGIYAGLQRTAA